MYKYVKKNVRKTGILCLRMVNFVSKNGYKRTTESLTCQPTAGIF